MKDDKKYNKNIFNSLAPYLNLGFQLTLTVLMGVGIGWWLDNKFNTKPILILVFSLVFIAAGMYNFIRTVSELGNREEKEE